MVGEHPLGDAPQRACGQRRLATTPTPASLEPAPVATGPGGLVIAVRISTILVVLAVALAVGACSSDDTSAPPALPADPEVIRTEASRAMGNVESARFSIERGGEVVHIDDADTLAFEKAEGRFAAPASSDALITVSAGGTRIEVGAVAVDGNTWITNPVTGNWEVAPESLAFDPATMFDPELGWRPLLASGLLNTRLTTPEADEDGRYHLQGDADAERISVLTGGLVEQGVPVDLWIDADTGLVEEARFPAETPSGPSTWRLLLSEYGTDIEVERPQLGADS